MRNYHWDALFAFPDGDKTTSPSSPITIENRKEDYSRVTFKMATAAVLPPADAPKPSSDAMVSLFIKEYICLLVNVYLK